MSALRRLAWAQLRFGDDEVRIGRRSQFFGPWLRPPAQLSAIDIFHAAAQRSLALWTTALHRHIIPRVSTAYE
jgi:hypothetical protein